MRAALWLLALFGVAVAAALFAGNNQGTITLYWPPYRIDFSLNMVVLLLVTSFVTVYAALRALAALLELPHQARRWRVQQKERAMHSAMLDALTHMLAGRFIRSRKAA
ncbi:MAG TPA: heme biosynthesis HemY N-terminal domain-containing protein, partial [Acidovorax defluvii]|nr:heme biosynthesis HemY N-terminal domain-containing protein [Acidovorax defluvii]